MRRWTTAVALAALVVTAGACNRRPSPTIGDQAFVKQANALCGRELKPLRAPKPESSDDPFGGAPTTPDDREAVARRIETVADGLDTVANHLGALTVRPADQAEVAGWLEEWANFTGIGRQYAAAVRAKPPATYTSIAAEGNGPIHRIATFARANRMDACIL